MTKTIKFLRMFFLRPFPQNAKKKGHFFVNGDLLLFFYFFTKKQKSINAKKIFFTAVFGHFLETIVFKLFFWKKTILEKIIKKQIVPQK